MRGSRKNVPFLPGGLQPRHEHQARAESKRMFALQCTAADLSQAPPDLGTVVNFAADGSIAEASVDELQEASTTLSAMHNRAGLMSAPTDDRAPGSTAAVAKGLRRAPVTDEEFQVTDRLLPEIGQLSFLSSPSIYPSTIYRHCWENQSKVSCNKRARRARQRLDLFPPRLSAEPERRLSPMRWRLHRPPRRWSGLS